MNNYFDLNDYELLYLVSEKDEDANRIIYEKYKPMIYSLANKYYKNLNSTDLELDDFIQEGFLGLSLAMNNYTEDKNCLFYTYANVVINSKMSNLISKSRAKKNIKNTVSLNSYIKDDDDTELGELIADKKAVIPESEVISNQLYSKIKELLYTLSIDDSCILELKINGFSDMDISRLLDIKRNVITYTLRNVRKRIISLKNYF